MKRVIFSYTNVIFFDKRLINACPVRPCVKYKEYEIFPKKFPLAEFILGLNSMRNKVPKATIIAGIE